MWILRMAWANLWRNKSRTAITIAAVAFATIISTCAAGLKDGIFDNLLKDIVSTYTGHIQIHKKGYQDEQTLENGFFPQDTLYQKLLSLNLIYAMSARLESFALIASNDKTKGCLMLGIEPDKEINISNLGPKIVKGSYFSAANQGVIVSSGLASRLRVDVNDTIVLIGQGYRGSAAAAKKKILGIVKLGSPKMNEMLVFMPLKQSQDYLDAASLATTWIILLKKHVDVEQAVIDLKKAVGVQYEVMSWGELMPDIKQHIDSDSNSMQLIQNILYVLVSFGIFSTILIMMVERRKEMGMLLSVGMSKWRLIKLFMAESMMTIMFGSFVGLIFSYPIIWTMATYPLKLKGQLAAAYQRFGFEPIFPASTDAEVFYKQSITVFVIGLLLSLYPMWVIVRMNALNAMRS